MHSRELGPFADGLGTSERFGRSVPAWPSLPEIAEALGQIPQADRSGSYLPGVPITADDQGQVLPARG